MCVCGCACVCACVRTINEKRNRNLQRTRAGGRRLAACRPVATREKQGQQHVQATRGSKSAAEMAKEVKKFRDESADRSRQRLPETYLTELLKELQTHEMARQDSRAEPVSAKARTKGADWNGICYPAHVWAVSMQKVVKLVKQKSVNGIWRPHEAAWKQSGQREAYIIGYKAWFRSGRPRRGDAGRS